MTGTEVVIDSVIYAFEQFQRDRPMDDSCTVVCPKR